MTLSMTAAQRRAVETHDRNLVVLAAAGSGKTLVLVERFMALLQARPDWPLESLVAITFTRKAAGEMRERLRERLRQRCRDAGDEARALWQSRLAGIDSACIGTIHSLCARILRAAAAEARLDPEFTVLEADEAGVALDESLEATLDALVEAQDPALALFSHYERAQIMDGLRAQVHEPAPDPVPDDLLEQWRKAWEREARKSLDGFLASPAFQAALTWKPPHGWPESDRLGEVWAVCRPLCLDLENAATAQSPGLLQTINDAIDLRGGSQKNWGDRETVAQAKNLLRTLREEVRLVQQEIGEGIGDLDRQAAKLLPQWRRLICLARDDYGARKRAANQVDFADLEHLTRELLQRPDARERFRREFRHVLVDEFHDTSPVQWEIIRALADPRDPGRLFIVGDPRQSIYGFRGADVDNFRLAQQEVLCGGGEHVELAQSFRSHQPLLDVLNALHRVALPGGAHEPLVAERTRRPGAHPALELLLMDRKAAGLNADEGHRELARALARRLRQLMDERLPVFDRGPGATRPLAFADVALLFRTRARMPVYEEALREAGLPFVTLEGPGFFGRLEVLDLLNLLRALRNPGDELALAAALRSPLFALSDDALLALRLMENDEESRPLLWDALQNARDLPPDDMPRARWAASLLRDLEGLAGRLTIEELLREIVRRTGYLATLGGLPDGDRRRGNVEKMLTMAATSKSPLFTGFETLFSDLVRREVREGDAALAGEGAITLMTAHGSKGLEFPLVVLADVVKWRGPGDRSVIARDEAGQLVCKVFDMQAGGHQPAFAWRRATQERQQRELDERRRLLYVASTRARDYLIVCANRDGPPGDEGWLAWLHEALEVEAREADVPYSIGRGEVVWRNLAATSADGVTPGGSAPQDLAPQDAAAPFDDAGVPALLRPLPPMPPVTLRTLAVTAISRHYEREQQDGAGAVTAPAAARDSLVLGNVLHEALRWWRPDANPTSVRQQTRLKAALWAQGERDPQRSDALLRQATDLLGEFAESSLSARMRAARTVLRELPFILRHGDCLIEGKVDLLLQEAGGRWTMVDFKTTYLGEGASESQAAKHAQRHWLQLGLYADALCRRPDISAQTLTVQVHYLRHSLDVVVPSQAWQTALTNLDDCLEKALVDSRAAD